ncbi:MAG: hypothetical protein ACK5LX_13850 [Oscillospiraceae bacterium]
MYAKKGNIIYQVDTIQQKDHYLAQGYDLYNAQGEIVKHNPAKTIAYSEYEQLLEENKQLKEQLEGKATPAAVKGTPPADPLEAMTVDDLKRYAADNKIDLGGATKKKDIVEVVRAALAENDTAGGGESEPAAVTSEGEPATLNGSVEDAAKMGGGTASVAVSSGQS